MEENSETNQALQNTPGQIPPAAPSELPPSDNAKKGKRKIFIGASLLAIAFILLIASAVLSQILGLSKQVHPISTLPTSSPTPDPTANWKTYTNKEIGYSFKYPTDWKVREDIFGNVNNFVWIEPLNNEFFETKWGNTISRTKVNVSISTDTTNSACLSEPEEIIIDRLKGFKGKETQGDGTIHSICATTKKENTNYYLQLTDKDFSKELLFDQILSTFTFE